MLKKIFIITMCITVLIFSGCTDKNNTISNIEEGIIRVDDTIENIVFNPTENSQVMFILPEKTIILTNDTQKATLLHKDKYEININFLTNLTKEDFKKNYIDKFSEEVNNKKPDINIPNIESLTKEKSLYIETINYQEDFNVLQIFAIRDFDDYLYVVEVHNIKEANFEDFNIEEFFYILNSTNN